MTTILCLYAQLAIQLTSLVTSKLRGYMMKVEQCISTLVRVHLQITTKHGNLFQISKNIGYQCWGHYAIYHSLLATSVGRYLGIST